MATYYIGNRADELGNTAVVSEHISKGCKAAVERYSHNATPNQFGFAHFASSGTERAQDW